MLNSVFLNEKVPYSTYDSRPPLFAGAVVTTELIVKVFLAFNPEVEDQVVQWVFAKYAGAPTASDTLCPQQDPWQPSDDTIEVKYPENNVLASRLSGAVKIDTSVHDGEAPPEDNNEPWKQRFEPFRDYLSKTYPLIHSTDGPVHREIVHEHGLLYTWKGSDESLKPLLLMAHQDVVPVDPETIGDWLAPPWSGDIVNGTVFGRGSTDAKSWLISILSSVEALLDSNFQPRRTVLLTFGYDEEANGPYGAQHLARRLEETYGKDSLAMIVDEGNPVMPETEPMGLGIPIALPAVEEKGNTHIKLRIEGPGGHSSGPPPRTTIGYASEILAGIETAATGKNLKEAVIPSLESAHLKTLQCARHSPFISHSVRQALKHLDWASRSDFSLMNELQSQGLLHRCAIHGLKILHVLTEDRRQRRVERAKQLLLATLPDALKLPFTTTQTPTVIHGGIKLNAIPPSVQVEIDHRVGLHHSIEDIKNWYHDHLFRFATKHDLQLSVFGQPILTDSPSGIKIFLDVAGDALSPTKSSPTSGPEAAPWNLLSSVIRSIWTLPDTNEPITVSPSQMKGNTDVSHWYRGLSKHLFRFGPTTLLADPTSVGSAFTGIHNVNEHFHIDGLEKASRFYAQLILAVDRAEI
ncbi:unnamed protein product [Sympodiomycopsis kandeliae]